MKVVFSDTYNGADLSVNRTKYSMLENVIGQVGEPCESRDKRFRHIELKDQMLYGERSSTINASNCANDKLIINGYVTGLHFLMNGSTLESAGQLLQYGHRL